MRSNLIHSTVISFLFLLPLHLSSIHSCFFTHAALLDQCAVATTALFMDPRVSACVPISPIEQFANGTTITPKLVNDTSTTFCAMPFCSFTTISLMENTLYQNCAYTRQDIDDYYWMYGVASLYVPFKQGVCQRVQDPPTNGTFCSTILTENLIAFNEKHPNKHGWAILGNSTETRAYLDSLPKEMVCTACNQAMINPLNTFVSLHQLNLDPSIVSLVYSVQQSIQAKCGEDFIQEVAPPQPSTTTSRAAVSFPLSSFPPIISIIFVATSFLSVL